MIADEIPIHSGTEHQLQTLWPDKPECQTILRIMAFQYQFTPGEDESHFAVKLAVTFHSAKTFIYRQLAFSS